MKKLILYCLKLYHHLHPPSNACRFLPTCSVYTYQAIDKYGILHGSIIGLRRILRCHPGSSGGYDPIH